MSNQREWVELNKVRSLAKCRLLYRNILDSPCFHIQVFRWYSRGIISFVLATSEPELATIVTGTIAAAAVINEIIAVIASKKGFELAGEIKEK